MVIAWPRFIVAFVLAAAAVALLAGIPTDVIPNGWYTRMTAVEGYSYPVLVVVSVLSGVLAASYWGVRGTVCPTRRTGAPGVAGAALSWFAIGCPICNKLIILALGASGALTYFAPVQPWLAALSIVLLLFSIGWRWRSLITTSRGPLDPAASAMSASS